MCQDSRHQPTTPDREEAHDHDTRIWPPFYSAR